MTHSCSDIFSFGCSLCFLGFPFTTRCYVHEVAHCSSKHHQLKAKHWFSNLPNTVVPNLFHSITFPAKVVDGWRGRSCLENDVLLQVWGRPGTSLGVNTCKHQSSFCLRLLRWNKWTADDLLLKFCGAWIHKKSGYTEVEEVNKRPWVCGDGVCERFTWAAVNP